MTSGSVAGSTWTTFRRPSPRRRRPSRSDPQTGAFSETTVTSATSRPGRTTPPSSVTATVGTASTRCANPRCASPRTPLMSAGPASAGTHLGGPVVQVPLHSTRAASRPPALRLGQIQAVFSLGAPCRTGASRVSVPRGTCTTGCYAGHSIPNPNRIQSLLEHQLKLFVDRPCGLWPSPPEEASS